MSQWPYGIRAATPADEDIIYNMLLELHDENGIFKVSETKVRNVIKEATSQQGGIIGIIGDNEPEASCGLEIGQWWYTDDWSLNEKWLFVRPAWRKQNHASRLMDWAKWCESQLDTPLFMGIISTKRTEAKERLYRRKLKHVGGMFMYANGRDIVTGARNN